MCMSSLHRVVGADHGSGTVAAVDLGGTRKVVSLLALDGGPPQPGEWLVVHSGYAIERVPADEVDAVVAEHLTLRGGTIAGAGAGPPAPAGGGGCS